MTSLLIFWQDWQILLRPSYRDDAQEVWLLGGGGRLSLPATMYVPLTQLAARIFRAA